MVSLRILGRDNDCDTISEMSMMGESTINNIFKQFVKGFADMYYTDFIKFPEGQELSRVMEVYRMLGLPGACGSMDGTHVKWAVCPKYLHHACKGKEGYPTLAWLISVSLFLIIVVST